MYTITHQHNKPFFGLPRPQKLPPGFKAAALKAAHALAKPTQRGKHYGLLTPKAIETLRALLFNFHGNNTGLCFPGYDAIASATGCARSTVARALNALEQLGFLERTHRLKRITIATQATENPASTATKLVRTSNAYTFKTPPRHELAQARRTPPHQVAQDERTKPKPEMKPGHRPPETAQTAANYEHTRNTLTQATNAIRQRLLQAWRNRREPADRSTRSTQSPTDG